MAENLAEILQKSPPKFCRKFHIAYIICGGYLGEHWRLKPLGKRGGTSQRGFGIPCRTFWEDLGKAKAFGKKLGTLTRFCGSWRPWTLGCCWNINIGNYISRAPCCYRLINMLLEAVNKDNQKPSNPKMVKYMYIYIGSVHVRFGVSTDEYTYRSGIFICSWNAVMIFFCIMVGSAWLACLIWMFFSTQHPFPQNRA